MRMMLRPICLVAALLAVTATGSAKEPNAGAMKSPPSTEGSALAKIQPRFGTLMNEYGNRFVDVYFAAEGDNWGFAQYQLKELRELQKVGELIRPGSAKLLKAFGDTYLAPLESTVAAKEWSKFGDFYRDAVKGCNECHVATGRAYIHFQVPARPVEDYIDFTRESRPRRRSRREEIAAAGRRAGRDRTLAQQGARALMTGGKPK